LDIHRVSTSVAYLRKRLADIGRYDLLHAAERGEVSFFAAAEAADLVRRKEVLGTGSENQAKKRAWAIGRITRQAPPLPPKPELMPAPEFSPKPAHPKFSQETRDTIERLVDLGRADLVIAIVERRLSPFAAARIARGGRRRTVSDHDRADATETATETSSGSDEIPMPVDRIDKVEKVEQAPEPKKPAFPKTLDPRALIA
jgi:hypothetical protein